MHGEDQSPVCVWMSDRVPPAIANTELEAALARARGRGGVAAQRRLKAIHLTILRRYTVQLQAVIGGGAESRSLRERLLYRIASYFWRRATIPRDLPR